MADRPVEITLLAAQWMFWSHLTEAFLFQTITLEKSTAFVLAHHTQVLTNHEMVLNLLVLVAVTEVVTVSVQLSVADLVSNFFRLSVNKIAAN